MKDTKVINVEVLDSGYIVTRDGKRQAMTSDQHVYETINDHIRHMMNLNKIGTPEYEVTITIDDNPGLTIKTEIRNQNT